MGLYAAKILAYLEAPLYSQDDDEGRLHERFDFICGTSVGGLLALGIAYGIRADSLAAALSKEGKAIFPDGSGWKKRFRTPWRLARMPFTSKYSGKSLPGAIDRVLGEARPLSDVKVSALITAVNLSDGSPTIYHAKPGTVLHRGPDGNEITAQAVAQATSAAPVYLPAAKVGGVVHADGGLVANAPDLIGVAKAVELGFDLDRIHVLSVGMTSSNVGIPANSGTYLGVSSWLKNLRILKISMAGQMGLSRKLTNQLLRDGGANRKHFVIDKVPSEEAAKFLDIDFASDKADREIDQLVNATITELDLETVRRDWIGGP